MDDTGTRIMTPFEGSGHTEWDANGTIPAPLQLYTTPVPTSWTDYNEHMSESSYLLAFGNNSDAFFRYIGIDEGYRNAGHSLFTVETHIHNISQARAGDDLALSLTVLETDAKRVHILHTMTQLGTDDPRPVALGEQLLVHVDTRIGKSTPLPEHLSDRLAAIQDAHADLARPAFVGRPLGIHHT